MFETPDEERRQIVEAQAGEAARVGADGWEVIGPEECPIMRRRTLLACRWFKLLVHRFEPDATDQAPHDHPRSFVTFVLRGGYDDLSLCPKCGGTGKLPPSDGFEIDCMYSGDYDGRHGPCEGGLVRDRVRAPAVRFRRAEHSHITKVLPEGATTLVLMGPVRRPWGFWRDGKWYEWRRFERLFGLNWRCPE